MKYFWILLLIVSTLFGSDDLNTTTTEDELIEIKDTSGVSEDELRKKANTLDDANSTKVSVQKVVDSINEQGEVDISKLQKSWEELSPKASDYDWVQTTSGEWFKGRIIGFYNDQLEFHSEEIDNYTFKLKNVAQIKSHAIVSVNIENIASISGILRYSNEKLKIIQGEHEYEFDISDVVSFAPDGDREVDFWSGKIVISLDARDGNTNQIDFTTDGRVLRRTADTVLDIKYLGRFSTREQETTANSQRLSQKYDLYQTRYFFITPLASEYYSDEFRNIQHQFTFFVGAGYTLFKNSDDEWKISVGPSAIYTQFQSVIATGEEKHSTIALEFSSNLNYEINKITDFEFNYNFTISDKVTGRYKHHMVTKLTNELTSWLDLDVSLIWDYLHMPQQRDDGTTPRKDDLQLLVGVGIDF